MATITTSFSNGDLFNATEISSAPVNSAGMAGMAVTMCFSGTGCENATWGSGAIGAEGGDYDNFDGWLFEAGSSDTFSDPFRISVEGRLLQSFTLYGLGAGVMFDALSEITESGASAPGSGNGKPFTLVELDPGGDVESIAVTYFDKVYVAGQEYSDLYLGMQVVITMTAASGLAGFQGFLRFQSDTDKIASGATLAPYSGPPPPPPPPPAPPVQIRSQAPGPLGVPLVIVGPVWTYAAVPGPLGAPRVLAWDSDFSATVAGLTSFYVMDVETPTGPVRVPISSWQATLRTGSQNYVKCVVPAALPWLDAINIATSFAIYRRALSVSGAAIEVEMARAAVGLVQINEGAQRVTATLSGNSSGFASEPDQLAPASGVLRGVRSASQSSSGLRVRCSIDWLLRPGQIATYKTSSFPVRFISYFVSIDDAYMDIAEQT